MGAYWLNPARDRVGDAGSQSWIDGVVREALPYIDRALFRGAARHHGEYRGADVGQFALEPFRKTHRLEESRRAPPYAASSSDAYFFLARFALRASFS